MLILVLETGTDLSAAVAAELRDRSCRAACFRRTTRNSWLSAEHAGRQFSLSRPVDELLAGEVSVESESSVQRIIQRIRDSTVTGIVLDLKMQSRQSLVLLRQLQGVACPPAVIAVGEQRHMELTPILLESGCSTLLTRRPCDRSVARWISRLAVQCSQILQPDEA